MVEPAAPPAATAATSARAHGFGRLREMVQDASRKGERLSVSQERVSSAAQRLTRRLEDEVRDLEGLIVRLTPMGAADAPPGRAPATGSAAEGARRLRVVEGAERPAQPGDVPRERQP